MSDCDLNIKIDLLIDMNKNLLVQLGEHRKIILELQQENKRILEDTTRMKNHIDFINGIYNRTRNSSFFRTIFG